MKNNTIIENKNKEENRCKENNIYASNSRRYLSLFLIIISILVAFVSKLMTVYILNDNWLCNLFFEIIYSISMAVMTGVAISTLIDLKEWKEYFGSHIKSLVLEDSYLKTLGPDKLSELEKKIAKIQYTSNEIETRGSLFSYIKERLFKLVGAPYRRDVSLGLKVIANEKEIEIHETLSYWCCPINGKHIENLFWTWQDGEIIDVDNIQLEIRKVIGEDDDLSEAKIYSQKDLDAKYRLPSKEIDHGYKIKTSDIVDVDCQFSVTFAVKYRIPIGFFYNWISVYATKNTHITISYEKCKMLTAIGGIRSDEYIEHKNENIGFYEYTQTGWAMPSSCIVFQFVNKKDLQSQILDEDKLRNINKV
jgi:hypothetical protein